MLRVTPSYIASLSDDDLVDLLRRAREAYFNGPSKIMSNADFDALHDALAERRPDHPALSEVGAAVERDTPLEFWMGSMTKMLDDKAISAWQKRQRQEEQAPRVFSDKLDGVSAMLRFKHGTVSMFTRGNGSKGQNISHLVPHVRLIPKIRGGSSNLAVRGELLFTREAWAAMTERGTNPLSVVAGLVNAKTPNLELARHIDFVAHELVLPGGKSPSQQWAELADLGFQVVGHGEVSDISAAGLTKLLVERRASNPYNMDGLVVMEDAPHAPVTSGNPTYAFAFKSKSTMEQAETTVTGVTWKTSKDGYMKPVVEFDPVNIKGFTVSKATGYNARFIAECMLGPGSRIVVIRSGDVIPTITKVLSGSKQPALPPGEGTVWDWNETRVDIRLRESSASTDVQQLYHFVERIGTKGVGPALVQRFYDAGKTTLPAIYAMSPADIAQIDGFQETSAANAHAALHSALRAASVPLLMAASSTLGRGMGERKLGAIVAAIPRLADPGVRPIPSVSELIAIPGIEQRTAAPLQAGLPKFWALYDELAAFMDPRPRSRTPGTAPAPAQPGFLSKEVFVFTGFRDKDLEARIIAAGGTVAPSVTSKVTRVIIKDEAGRDSTKARNAEAKGIPLVLAADFAKFLSMRTA
jgi:NAD-dependent DNA ligase